MYVFIRYMTAFMLKKLYNKKKRVRRLGSVIDWAWLYCDLLCSALS